MEKWEYMTRFFEASANDDDTKAFIESRFQKKPKKHSPEALIPQLNALGEQGWEVIHMEPVPGVGRKEDVGFDRSWSSTYFCVLKRRKPGSFVPIMPATYQSDNSADNDKTAPADSPPPPPESKASES